MDSIIACWIRVAGRLMFAAVGLAVIDLGAVHWLILRNTQSGGDLFMAIARDFAWCFSGMAAAAAATAAGVALARHLVPWLQRFSEAQLTGFGAVAMATPLGFVGIHHFLMARVIGGSERLGWLAGFGCLVLLVALIPLIQRPGRALRQVLEWPIVAASVVALLPLYINASVDVVATQIGGEDRGASELAASSAANTPAAIVLVTLDTTRFDAVGYSGSGRTRTPVLDRLAAEGASFLQATTPTPVTLPSHSSMFAGLPPREHGVQFNGVRIPHDLPLLTQYLSDAGWRTGAFISAAVLDGNTGLSRGFETYDDILSGGWRPTPQLSWVRIARRAGLIDYPYTRTAEVVTSRALSWIERDDDRPAFLWVHYFDAHSPYEPDARPVDTDDERIAALSADERARYDHGDDPPAWYVEAMRNLYEREVEQVDAQLGRLIEGLERRGWHDSGLLIALADHGESFAAPSIFDHADVLTEGTIHIPLIVRWPGVVPAGSNSDALASVQDVQATILEAAGMSHASSPSSHSLIQAAAPKRPGRARTHTIHDTYPHPMGSSGEKLTAVRTAVSKLVSAPESDRISFFHLDDVEGERRDRIHDTDRGETVASLGVALVPPNGASRTAEVIDDAHTLEMLKGLGYVE